MRLGSAERQPGGGADLQPDQAGIVLDVAGVRIDLPAPTVLQLRDAAAAEAGRSSRARDLSLVLDRALARPHTVALRPGERHTLARIAGEAGMDDLVPLLERAAG